MAVELGSLVPDKWAALLGEGFDIRQEEAHQVELESSNLELVVIHDSRGEIEVRAFRPGTSCLAASSPRVAPRGRRHIAACQARSTAGSRTRHTVPAATGRSRIPHNWRVSSRLVLVRLVPSYRRSSRTTGITRSV